ncbi:MAG TPA: hypothetical protein VN380_08950, partial [Thermoanaerobaculia bacterium]|nr:hypothetical protein [Thermoanaerobaculia bacterium]
MEAVTEPDLLPHEHPVLTDVERHRILVDFNATQADYPKDKCIHQLFSEQVAVHPDRTAVVFGERALSYRELYD